MATGDIKNNIRKLKRLLTTLHYEGDIDLAGLTEGNATVYLPIYHYAFTGYSPKVAEFIHEKNFELYGKSDARFIEVIYKILRDLFSYKPPVTKDKFFAKGFAERKIIMCTEILQLIKDKHTELNPGASKTAMKTSVRPRSSIETRTQGAALKSKRPSTARVSPRLTEGYQVTQTAHVVNELTTAAVAPPVRHTAHNPEPRSMPRHIAERAESVSSQPQNLRQPPEYVTVRSSVTDTCENASQIGLKTTLTSPPDTAVRTIPPGEPSTNIRPAFTSPPTAAMRTIPTYDLSTNIRPAFTSPPTTALMTCPQSQPTPCIRHCESDLVEVVTMPRRPSSVAQDISIVDVQANTNTSMHDPAIDTQQLRSMLQHVESLTDCLTKRFEDTVKIIHDNIENGANSQVMTLENRILPQLENLKAQMVLMDNRLQIVEMKVDSIYKPSANLPQVPSTYTDLSVVPQQVTINDNGSSFATQQRFLADPRVKNLSKEPINVSLDFSPIRKTTNGTAGKMFSGNEDTFISPDTEQESRRSSTPTGHSRHEPSFLGAASRIEQMIQNTNQTLKDKADIPSLRNNVD